MTGRAPCVAGINLGHDGGAAIVTENGMVAIGEERLNRTRYSPGWQASLLYCLRAAGLRLADIDLVAVSGIGDLPPDPAEPGLHHLGVDRARVLPVDHHLAHAYSGYCLSGFGQATVLVIDGAGNNGDTETWYAATPDQITRAGGNHPARRRSSGIGATYEAFTNYLGWHEQEAGKTMALAAYGDPGAYPEPLFDTDGPAVTGRLRRTHEQGVTDLAARTGWDFGPPGSHGRDQRGTDAAAYVQAQTTLALCKLAEGCVSGTGLPDLCLAGGVALNCVAADHVRRLPAVRGYFAPPPASDRGQALGCALIGWHRLTGQMPRRPLGADSLGRPYTDGQRSILADPRTIDSAATLNTRVKHREPFRPFAPAILDAHAGDWFDLDVPSPYMLLAPPVRPAMAGRIAAVVHVDGTARVHTVHQSASPRLNALLSEFLRITGVPAVLNTSFNDREPIVETPAHALATFQDTSLDALCIGDYLAEKA